MHTKRGLALTVQTVYASEAEDILVMMRIPTVLCKRPQRLGSSSSARRGASPFTCWDFNPTLFHFRTSLFLYS